MLKNKPMARMMRVLITLLGAGVGAAVAALLTPIFSRLWPDIFGKVQWIAVLYAGLALLLGLRALYPKMRKKKLSPIAVFFAQHTLNPREEWYMPRLRNVVYTCLGR